MSLQVLPPQFDSEKKRYVFTFKGAPRFEETTVDPTKLGITEEEISDFITEFLKQASKYFSKPLEPPIFFKRLTHTYVTEEVDLSVRDRGETFRATWVPAHIIFYTGRYEIQWTLCEVEAVIVSSTIPPGFLNELGVDGEEILPEAAEESELPELPIAEVQQGVIPFGGVPPDEKAKKCLDRKHIRQARLRAALSKLRAERLAERYYKRYGNFDWGDSESELSSDSDTPPLEDQSRKI